MSRGSGSKSVDVPNGSEAVDHAPTARRPLWFPKLITITRPLRRPQHRCRRLRRAAQRERHLHDAGGKSERHADAPGHGAGAERVVERPVCWCLAMKASTASS